VRRPGGGQLVVMARWPASGRCKRRLAHSLGGQPAARIQARLTAHTLAVAHSLTSHQGVEVVLAVDGVASRAARRWGETLGADRCLLQGPGSLGLRMQRQFVRAAREGAERVVLIGSDLPQLEASDLASAFGALNSRPAVLGPARDGGYWLIGLRQPDARLMGGIAWGTALVLEQTLAAMAQRGLEPVLLSCRGDLDRVGDLRLWR
jgi:rSAM/selenodomain-associated transferase 1